MDRCLMNGNCGWRLLKSLSSAVVVAEQPLKRLVVYEAVGVMDLLRYAGGPRPDTAAHFWIERQSLESVTINRVAVSLFL